MQAAAGLEQYIALDRPDIAYSVTADVEAFEAHASSSGASRSLLEEQSETDLEVPVSTAAEEHRRVCGC